MICRARMAYRPLSGLVGWWPMSPPILPHPRGAHVDCACVRLILGWDGSEIYVTGFFGTMTCSLCIISIHGTWMEAIPHCSLEEVCWDWHGRDGSKSGGSQSSSAAQPPTAVLQSHVFTGPRAHAKAAMWAGRHDHQMRAYLSLHRRECLQTVRRPRVTVPMPCALCICICICTAFLACRGARIFITQLRVLLQQEMLRAEGGCSSRSVQRRIASASQHPRLAAARKPSRRIFNDPAESGAPFSRGTLLEMAVLSARNSPQQRMRCQKLGHALH